MEGIIASLITGGLALIGVIITNVASNKKIEIQLSKQQAITDTKLEELTKKVEKHNQVIDRVYKLEQQDAVTKETLKVANHRIEDLEKKVG